MSINIPKITLKRNDYILGIALLFGFLTVLQGRSFEEINETLVRDTTSNIFQEVALLKANNEALKKEIEGLENTVMQFSDQNSALIAVEDQIKKYRKLSGSSSVFGPGVTLTIDGKISTPWLIDLINALFNSGAEAVAVNGIRISNKSMGFDTLPQGQILLNGSILSSPYNLDALGQSSTLKAILEAPGGILSRLKAAFPNVNFELSTKEVIQMD